MSELMENHTKYMCELEGIPYVEPDGEGRDAMMAELAARRAKRAKDAEERRKTEEAAFKEKTEREEAERSHNAAHLTVAELLSIWRRRTPPRFRDADISNVGSGRQMQAILSGASALILGANGVGKTYTAYALAKAWAEKAQDAMVIKATELLGAIKSCPDPFKAIRERYGRSVRHLVIDEIDKIFESKADFVYLNYLVDHRYEWMLQTVVLGNGDKQGFIDNLGQSIYSRLTGDGGMGLVLNRPDRRK